MITDKDVDHIPLHRQEGRLARQGVEISRSTLCDWMGSAAKLLEPLYNLMKTLILLSGTIHTDDTTVKVRDSKRKIKRTGRLWFYGDCPRIHPCSRMPLGFRWALALPARAQPSAPLSPSTHAGTAGAAPNLQKIVGQADQLPLG